MYSNKYISKINKYSKQLKLDPNNELLLKKKNKYIQKIKKLRLNKKMHDGALPGEDDEEFERDQLPEIFIDEDEKLNSSLISPIECNEKLKKCEEARIFMNRKFNMLFDKYTDLEHKMEGLTYENIEVNNEVDSLKDENKELKQELKECSDELKECSDAYNELGKNEMDKYNELVKIYKEMQEGYYKISAKLKENKQKFNEFIEKFRHELQSQINFHTQQENEISKNNTYMILNDFNIIMREYAHNFNIE
jgi:chromosome segregation ATPase